METVPTDESKPEVSDNHLSEIAAERENERQRVIAKLQGYVLDALSQPTGEGESPLVTDMVMERLRKDGRALEERGLLGTALRHLKSSGEIEFGEDYRYRLVPDEAEADSQ